MAPNPDDMLPQTDGPKLGKFKNGRHKKVQFVKSLGSGAHSHVWKVKIDNRVYALKMFRHIRAEEENAAPPAKLERFERLGINLQLMQDQLTPFNCEARAYGRLKETGNEDIAWRCYGYIALDEATYSSDVWDKIGLPRRHWFSQTIDTDEAVADKPVFPILALVKEFIPDAGKLGAIDIAKAHDMAQGINRLHDIGITHRDIQERNFVDSRIMDFSTSWTVPNMLLDRALKWDDKQSIDQNDTNDYFMFDNMIEQWNNDHPNLPRSDYRMTKGDRYRPKTKAPGAARRKSSSSSGSSDDMEEIPIMERMRDNRYLVLASSYDWVGKKPAVAQPDILAPLITVPKDGGDQGSAGLPTPPKWPPLAFYVPDSPIAGFPLAGARFPTPDTPWTPPSTTEATVPGPSTLDDQQAPPGPPTPPRPDLGNWVASLNLTPPRNLEGGKLTAIREAATNISSTCDALKAMVENLMGVIDREDSMSPGTQLQQEQQQQEEQQQQAAQQPERAARPSRRRRRPHDEDNGVDESAPPLRRLRPRRK